MYTPLLSRRPSSSKFSANYILPSIVFVLLLTVVLFNDSYVKKEEPVAGGFPGLRKETTGASCALFEAKASKKCGEIRFGPSWNRYYGVVDMKAKCKGAECNDGDRFVCCVRPILCKYYVDSSGQECPEDKEPNAMDGATCNADPCAPVDATRCCVKKNSQWAATGTVKVYDGMVLPPKPARWILGMVRPQKTPGASKVIHQTRLGEVLHIEQFEDDPKDKEVKWAKLLPGPNGEQSFALVNYKKSTQKDKVRSISTGITHIKDCSKTAKQLFPDAKAGDTFQINCPKKCNFEKYPWKPISAQKAFSEPSTASEAIESWDWTPDMTPPIKFKEVEEHNGFIWGKYEQGDSEPKSTGYFKLVSMGPGNKAFANMQETGVIGCATTKVRKWADYVSPDSPVCIAARTRFQFYGNMEITFGAQNKKKYTACARGGVQTIEGTPKDDELGFQVGLSGTQQFISSSNRFTEVMKRKWKKIQAKGVGKVIVKMALKGVLGIALALAVSAATAATVATAGGAAAVWVPFLIHGLYAIPQGIAGAGIGLLVDVTVDTMWERFSKPISNDATGNFFTKLGIALKKAAKAKTWASWIGDSLKGMLWPQLSNIPGVTDAVTGLYGGLLYIAPDSAHPIQMSVAFTGWLMNTIFGLFSAASDRGLTRIDVFARMVGLGDFHRQQWEMAPKGEGSPSGTDVGVYSFVASKDWEKDFDGLVEDCATHRYDEAGKDDPEKYCIFPEVTLKENGTPEIPIALVGQLATNIGMSWTICEEESETETGKVQVQEYYCLGSEGDTDSMDEKFGSDYMGDYSVGDEDKGKEMSDEEWDKLGERKTDEVVADRWKGDLLDVTYIPDDSKKSF